MEKDYLTGLLSIKDYIIQGGELVDSTDDPYVSISVDVSNFKYLNDVYGIDGGDEAIVMMSEMFTTDSDCILAARSVGDQFRGLFKLNNRTIDEFTAYIEGKAHDMENRLTERFPKVYLHIYVGIYEIDRSDFNMRISIDKAHFAKKQIKDNFRVTCNLYKDSEYKGFSQQMDMIKTFEKARSNDGVKVFFQPKFDCESNTLIGAEALCRLQDDNGDIIPPGLFIPVLEKNGMLGHLDEIMIHKTLEHMKKWKEDGKLTFPVSVNLSRINFYNNDIATEIFNINKTFDIPTDLVELEITETTFIEDLKIINESIEKLRKYGFRISVDDFGSGYSSLGLLTSIPADVVKLDCSFARQSLKTEKGIQIVKSIISMLKSVDFDIVCEGIETPAEEELIHSLGCSKIQGYLYDRPLPAEVFEAKYLYKK